MSVQESSIEISFTVSPAELREALTATSGIPLFLPYPQNGSDYARAINFIDDSPESHARLAQSFLSQENYTFKLALKRTREQSSKWRPGAAPSFGLYPKAGGSGWSNRSAKYTFNATKNTLVPAGFDDSGSLNQRHWGPGGRCFRFAYLCVWRGTIQYRRT